MLSKAKTKYIQTLGQKKQREAEGLFIAEGPKIVAELIQSIPGRISQVYALKEWIRDNSEIPNSIPVEEITEIELEKITLLSAPNKVLALVTIPGEHPPLIIKGKITLLLDTIQDPGNLGTIIRIADWFGIGQIVCSYACADQYNPKVIQATMGSLARVQVVYADLDDWLDEHPGVPVYAAALEGEDISTMKKISEGIIIIGNESKGIQSSILQRADITVTIPRKGSAESLNAAVACGIILSHVC